jgi:hypothetical protein
MHRLRLLRRSLLLRYWALIPNAPMRTGSRAMTRFRSMAEVLGLLQISRTRVAVTDRLGILAI